MTGPIRQAVVLAGGKGTRLGELTASTPKPLLPVGGRPFVEWVLDNLARHGVLEVILTVGHRADVFEAWLAAWTGTLDVSLFVEESPLDTGGALCELGDRLDDAFFVVNGDTLFDAPLAELGNTLFDAPPAELGDTLFDASPAELEDAVYDAQALAAMTLRPVSDTSRYGSVAWDGGIVTAFGEKAATGPGLINGGVYAFRREALKERQAPLSIERTLLPELTAERRVTGLPCDGFFIDIGVPQSFEEAQESVPAWWQTVTSTGGAP